jgi:hyaluronan synthase
MAFIKIGAMLTIRQQRWLTRQVAVEGGAVIRTTRRKEEASV